MKILKIIILISMQIQVKCPFRTLAVAVLTHVP